MSNQITSPAQADALLRAIDDEMETLQQKARDIKSQRNTLVPISRLPLELLADIFYEVVRLHDSTTRTRPSRPYGYSKYKTHRWLVVTFVCRAWRALALDTPRLWSHILFSDNAERMELFLARSCNAPLIAHAWHTQHTPVVRALFDVMHRVQELSLPPSMFRPIHELAEEKPHGLNSPVLRTITVSLGASSLSTVTIPSFTAAVWPKLSSLPLNDGNFSILQALVRPTLTNLSVVAQSSEETNINVIAWISVLHNLPCLKNLCLNKAIASRHRLEKPQSPMSTKVDLPQLNTLKLEDDGKGVDYAYLLRHLAIPADTLLHFEQGRTGDNEDNECIISAFASQLSRLNNQGSQHAPVYAVEICEWTRYQTSIQAFCDPLTAKSTIRYSVLGIDEAITCYNIVLASPLGFNDTYGSDNSVLNFPFSFLSEVHILGTSRTYIKECKTWRVLSQLSNVREVSVSCKPQALQTFLEFMLNVNAFPHLERLVIGDDRDKLDEGREPKFRRVIYVPSRLVRMLGDMLRARDSQGLRVKRLALSFCVEDDGDGGVDGPNPFQVSYLRAWVDDLIYRDDALDSSDTGRKAIVI
ncbi:F-box protein [Phanerochaete sordida]|uniref:F-box protein n=1 Tax=Phanerochaete sordida TaxID=48140 RepID=A0A9P3G6A0_9APHY|nr:F-box protein [Phanerochaete sordida]